MFSFISKLFSSPLSGDIYPNEFTNLEAPRAPRNYAPAPVIETKYLTASRTAEYVYVSLIVLLISSQRFESAAKAVEYTKKTFSKDFAEYPNVLDTDLFRAIHVLHTKNVALLNQRDEEENKFYLARNTLDLAKVQIIVDAILSTKIDESLVYETFDDIALDLSISIFDMTYYAGWAGEWTKKSIDDRYKAIGDVYDIIMRNEQNGAIFDIYAKFAAAEYADALAAGIVEENTTEESLGKQLLTAGALGVGTYYLTRKLLGN